MSAPNAGSGPSPTTERESWRGVVGFLVLAYGLARAAQIALSLAVRDDAAGVLQLGGGMLVVAAALMWPPALRQRLAADDLSRRVQRSGRAATGAPARRRPGLRG